MQTGLRTWYMGTELALYWSVLSVYTSSVMRAYFLPLRGVLGAGDGGRSWPSMSCVLSALLVALAFPLELSATGDSDMIGEVAVRLPMRIGYSRGEAGCANLRVEANSDPVAVECN
jgi:hypothetical protein